VSEPRTPDEIRSEIDQTREELAETAAALAYKTDVKARAHDRVDEIKSTVTERVDGIKETVTGRAGEVKDAATEATPQGAADAVSSAATSATETARRNPLPVAVIAAALAGLALGYVIARRRNV